MLTGDGMKRKTIVVCALLLLLSLYGIQYRRVNEKYPVPQNINVCLNETLQIKELEISPLKAELLDGQQIQQIVRNSITAEKNDTYDYHDMKLYLMTVLCRNISAQKNSVDFTQWMVESGAWGNGINGEFFKIMNEKISIIQKLDSNEEIIVRLPFTMVKSMFTKKEWKKLNERDFNIIVSLYPKKIMLKGNKK